MNQSNTVSNSDLLDTRAVVVTHRYSGETRVFYMKSDGSAVFSVDGHGKLRNHKLAKNQRGDVFLGWTMVVADRRRTENLYIHRLMWCAFHNDGVYLNGSDGMEIDHVDNDPTNNHPSNLQRISAADNQRKANAKRWHGKLSETYRLLASLDAA